MSMTDTRVHRRKIIIYVLIIVLCANKEHQQVYEKEASGIGAVWIAFVKNWITWGLMSEILSLMVDVAGGTWLQLMCCALPKMSVSLIYLRD